MSENAARGLTGGEWLNEPASWSLDGDVLAVVTGGATDFWRDTWYGFRRDSGHCFHVAAPPAFTAEVRIRAGFQALYDQAGLMLRLDDTRWLKAGIEFNDGAPMIAAVLTDGMSDWSVAPFAGDPGDFRLRMTVLDGAVRLQYSTDGRLWPLLRLAPFPKAPAYRVGPMCCTPERAGLEVAFSGFRLTPPNGKDLHDLS